MNASEIYTDTVLSSLLADCGYPSEPPDASPFWESWRSCWRQARRPPLARHLTGDGYRGIFVAVSDNALRVYQWLVLACELKGEILPEALIEAIEMTASPDRAPAAGAACLCLNLPLPFNHYDEIEFIGVDETNGRYGQVTVKQCRHCDRYWLHYAVEYEAYPESGRYFMGLVTPATIQTLTPEQAVPYLAGLEWRLYGGSYFNGKGKSTGQKIRVDC